MEGFQLKAANGKSMQALEVFSSAISFLKQHLLDAINITRLDDDRLEANDVLWVLTVPAIWSEKSKHFMIAAAKKAGIDKADLCIALEPECAAILGNKLYSNKNSSEVAKVGAKYMVIDLGGGTCDIVVHELLENGDAKEIERAIGTDAGGTTVDKKFQEYLGKILTMTVIEEMKAKYPADWKNIERDLELVKKSLNDCRGSAIVTLTSCLDKVYMAFNSICISEAFKCNEIEQTVKEHVDMQGEHRLKIDKLIIENMLREVFRLVKNEIQALLDKSEINLDYVILVGGFSNSSVILKEMEDHFNPIPVVRPHEAELAVLRGAVLYGLRKNPIRSRISRKTYGYRTKRKFEDGDPECQSYYDDEKSKLCDAFETIVTIGESVKTGDKVTQYYRPVNANQTAILLNVYSSEKKNVKYCNEEGVDKVGTLLVDMPDTTGGKDRKVKIEISFGKTYMQVEATDPNSGKVFNATFDFLCK